jgi:hypothetical protein
MQNHYGHNEYITKCTIKYIVFLVNSIVLIVVTAILQFED